MAVEQFSNFAQTTLASPLSSGATSLTVTSATSFPSTPQFRIQIDSELLLVTALGTNWTVQRGIEGTTAVMHSSGATVTTVVTAGAIPNALNANYATASGSATYTVTFSPAPTTYTTGPFVINFPNTNTGAATLNPNGLGAVAIQYQGNALVAGQIVGGTTYTLIYDGTYYQIIGAAQPVPQRFVYPSSSGTFNTPAGCKWLEVEMAGGGAGGVGSGTSPTAPTAGGNTTFGSSFLTANGGAIGSTNTGGAGGTASGGDLYLNLTGGNGGDGVANVASTGANNGGIGGGSALFGGGGTTRQAGTQNTGGGGSGATGPPGVASGGGGGGGGSGGGSLRKIIPAPASSYGYVVGAGGSAGGAGTGGQVGYAGAPGIIIVTAYF